MRRCLFMLLFMTVPPNVLPAADSAFLLNDQCVQCHLLSEQTGKPNSVMAWKQSVHFRPDAGCADCHGGDKFIRMDFRKGHIGLPERSRIMETCGKCHAEEQKQFMEKLNAAGPSMCAATCTDCHGYHLVRTSGSDLINAATCGRCHPVDRSAALAAALKGFEDRVQKLTVTMDDHKRKRIPVDTVTRQLAKTKKELSQAIHSRTFEALMKYLNTEADQNLNAVEERLAGFSPGTWRLEGVVVTGFLVIAFVLVIGYQTSRRKKR
jgi:hypothetical protein